MIQLWALYLDFEGGKDIHILEVLIWGFRGCWRFLTRVWHLDFNLKIVTGLYYKNAKSLALYPDFEDAKNIHIL